MRTKWDKHLVLSNELIKVELPPWKIWKADVSLSFGAFWKLLFCVLTDLRVILNFQYCQFDIMEPCQWLAQTMIWTMAISNSKRSMDNYGRYISGQRKYENSRAINLFQPLSFVRSFLSSQWKQALRMWQTTWAMGKNFDGKSDRLHIQAYR